MGQGISVFEQCAEWKGGGFFLHGGRGISSGGKEWGIRLVHYVSASTCVMRVGDSVGSDCLVYTYACVCVVSLA